MYTDGWARGNPWPAGCGFVLYDESGNIIDEGYKPLGHATNNQAEYWWAIYGLSLAQKHDATHITLCMDSELVVKQLRGEYKVKNPDMKELFGKIQEVVRDFTWALQIVHVPREKNTYADKLSNQAMDLVL